tara:strand:+ start:1102 stop:1323 length:222 start_codon:yes stop_codon:yes gene_type:complete
MNEWTKLVNKIWNENKHKPKYMLADAMAEAKVIYRSVSKKVTNLKKKTKSQKKKTKSQKKKTKSQKKRGEKKR